MLEPFASFERRANALCVRHGNYTVYTNFTSTNWIDNPYPLQLPSGRVLLIVRNHYRQPFSNFLEYRFTMFASDDNGDTFYYVNEAVTKLPSAVPNTGGQGIYEPFMRIAQDGSTIQLYYSEEDNPTGDADQNSMMRTSTDGGQTWSNPPKQISGEGITTRDGMLGVVNTGGSKLIAVFEVFGDSALVGGGSTVGSVFSPDDGVTWGNRTDVYVPATDRSAGSPQVIQVGTTTVVSFMNSNGVAGGGLIGYNGTAATIRTSSDGGHTWGTPFDVISTGANEPGLLTLRHTHTHNSSFALMTAIEQQAQTTLDGILVSQRVNLS